MKPADHHKVPEISIDDALQLYLSIAFPQGLPEGEEGAQILSALRKKIAQDRPEWASASNISPDPSPSSPTYSKLKAEIVDQANQEEIPDDPEERYLFLRRKEAKENRLQKQEEEKESRKESDRRKASIETKQAADQELQRRAALIKRVIMRRAGQRMAPRFGASMELGSRNDSPDVPFKPTLNGEGGISMQPEMAESSSTVELGEKKTKPDAYEWFSDFKSLSMEDRAASIREFNLRKRSLLHTREEILSSRKPNSRRTGSFGAEEENGFSIDHSLGFGDESPQKKNHGLRLE